MSVKNETTRLQPATNFLGIPSQILAESAVTRWVLFNWDIKDNKPLKGELNDQ